MPTLISSGEPTEEPLRVKIGADGAELPFNHAAPDRNGAIISYSVRYIQCEERSAVVNVTAILLLASKNFNG
jgi:hypothetical protein